MRIVAVVALLAASVLGVPGPMPDATAAEEARFTVYRPGAKVPVGAEGHYLVFGFDKTPKMGQAVFRVEIFKKDGTAETGMTVEGEVDMPSMRGAHSSGGKKFALSNKGVYLLPVQIVMPGEWEVAFTVSRAGKPLLRAKHLFNV